MCTCLFWMEHYGIWNRNILGFVKLLYCKWTGSSSVQVMACCISSTKLILESMLIYFQFDPLEQTSVKFYQFDRIYWFSYWKELVSSNFQSCSWFIDRITFLSCGLPVMVIIQEIICMWSFSMCCLTTWKYISYFWPTDLIIILFL